MIYRYNLTKYYLISTWVVKYSYIILFFYPEFTRMKISLTKRKIYILYPRSRDPASDTNTFCQKGVWTINPSRKEDNMAHDTLGYSVEEVLYYLKQLGYENPTERDLYRHFFQRSRYFYERDQDDHRDRFDYHISITDRCVIITARLFRTDKISVKNSPPIFGGISNGENERIAFSPHDFKIYWQRWIIAYIIHLWHNLK